jgi:hypothetical protein
MLDKLEKQNMAIDNSVLFDDEDVRVDPTEVANQLLAQLQAKGIPDKLVRASRLPAMFGYSTATIANLFKKGYVHRDGSTKMIEKHKVEGKGDRVSIKEICEWVLNRAASKRGGAGKGRALSSVVIRFNNVADLEVIRSFASVNGFTVLTASELAKLRKEKAAKKVVADSAVPA